MSDFDAGKKIWIEFSKKLIITSSSVPKRAWSEEKGTFLPVLGADGQPEQATETRIKLPMSSQHKGFVFTTQEPLRVPHKFKYDKEAGKNVDLGQSETLNSVQLFENVTYKITRTPYVLGDDGQPVVENGRKKLDFERQEIVKLTGAELKKEMDSWKKDMKRSAAAPTNETVSQSPMAAAGRTITADEEGNIKSKRRNMKPAEKWTEAETLMFMVENDIALHGEAQKTTLEAIKKAGYELKDGAITPRQEETKLGAIKSAGAMTMDEKLMLMVETDMQLHGEIQPSTKLSLEKNGYMYDGNIGGVVRKDMGFHEYEMRAQEKEKRDLIDSDL